MLAISPNASEAIRGIAAANEAPDDAVLRIVSQPDTGLQIHLVDGPAPDDVLIEEEGARLAIEPAAAALLDDKRLDASFSEGEGVTFTVSDQDSGNGVPGEPPPA
jgi:iron-sulfur cluster assembly protein